MLEERKTSNMAARGCVKPPEKTLHMLDSWCLMASKHRQFRTKASSIPDQFTYLFSLQNILTL